MDQLLSLVTCRLSLVACRWWLVAGGWENGTQIYAA